MIKKLPYLLLLIGCLVISSCASKKEMIYFQGDAASTTLYEQAVPKIQLNDMLIVNVSSANMKAAEAFSSGETSRSMSNPTAAPNVYTVNDDGSIELPLAGKVRVAGLTRTQAVDIIKERLKPFIIDAGVNVSYANFKVSVIGEVASPGTFTLASDRITILEAVALAGDLTIQGKRQNVLVIREADGQKNTFSVDLTTKEVLDSPVYYLAQNDVVYVEPNNAKIQSSVINYTAFLSVASIIISLITVLTL